MGGCTASIIVVSNYFKKSKLKWKIAIIDADEHHYYQPLWTLVGIKVSSLKSSRKDMKSIMPKGVQ